MKTLIAMSENKDESAYQDQAKSEYLRSIDAEFENFIPHILDMIKNQTKFSEEMRMQALTILANLALRDYLRPQIQQHGGMDLFLNGLRCQMGLHSTDSKRVSAKGLVNLVSNRRDMRLQVVAELTDEIKQIYRNEIDPIVAAYIQTLLHQSNP